MWLLPSPIPPEARIKLPHERHLLPWHLTADEVSRAAGLFAALLSGVEHPLVLPWPALAALAAQAERPSFERALLVAVMDSEVDAGAIDEALAKIGCPTTLVKLPAPQPAGYGWQERFIKRELLALIQEHLQREDHPLAALSVGHLPVALAASMTAEALELVELLEDALSHRLRRAGEGLSEADYEASVFTAAGQRLASRLLRLRPYEVETALEVLLAEGVGVSSNERFRDGAAALEKAGLARFLGGSVALGPLAQRALRRGNQGFLARALEKIPERYWSKLARERMRAIRPEPSAVAPPDRDQAATALFDKVEAIAKLREGGRATVERRPSPAPLEEHLFVTPDLERGVGGYPVGAALGPLTIDLLEAFLRDVDAPYRAADPWLQSTLVYDGPGAPSSLVTRAEQMRCRVMALSSYRSILDVRLYLDGLVADLDRDPPREEGPASIAVGFEITRTDHALDAALDLLSTDRGRLLVLTGGEREAQTELLREIARKLLRSKVSALLVDGASGGDAVDGWIARALIGYGVTRLDLDAIHYAVREGDVTLLIDGLGERAGVVFEGWLGAALPTAKVVITGHRGLFSQPNGEKTALGLRISTVRGHRIVDISPVPLDAAPSGFESLMAKRDIDLRPPAPAPAHARAIVASSPSPCFAVSASPDGALLATGHLDGSVRLWDLARGAPLFACGGHAAKVSAVTFSPDGLSLASASDDATVRVWDLMSGAERAELRGHQGSVNSVVFSPDGRSIASASDDLTVRIWDVGGADSKVLTGHEGAVRSVVYSPDGLSLASASSDQTILLWSSAEGARVAALKGHVGGVRSVAFSPDGRWLASGSDDATVKVWDLARRSVHAALEGHTDFVWSVVFSPDGETLASTSGDKTVRLWDVHAGSLRRVLGGHAIAVWGAAFLPDGKTIASVSGDMTLRVWDVMDGVERFAISTPTEYVSSAAFSPDGRALACAFSGGNVTCFDVAGGSTRFRIGARGGYVNAAVFSPDGKTFAVGSDEKVALLRDASTTRVLHVLRHPAAVRDVAFTPDNRWLVTGASDGSVRLWDPQRGSQTEVLLGHKRAVNSVAASPDGRLLASGSADKDISIWDIDAGMREVFRGHDRGVTSVRFSARGDLLASGSLDMTLKLWSLDGAEVRVFKGHDGGVRSVAFSPNDEVIASGSADRTILLWDVARATVIRVLRGHGSDVTCVVFSPDGRLLASASSDGTLRLWSTATWDHLVTLLPRAEGWAAILPDGRYKMGGDVAGAFWHVAGLTRHEPGAIDGLRLPDDAPLVALPAM